MKLILPLIYSMIYRCISGCSACFPLADEEDEEGGGGEEEHVSLGAEGNRRCGKSGEWDGHYIMAGIWIFLTDDFGDDLPAS